MFNFLIIKYKKNNTNENRIHIVVSLKVSKKAVVRNKIKRRIREILREIKPHLPTGYDMLIITNKDIIGKKYGEIRNNLKNQISNLPL